jgi:endo-1,4-beta-xylanase
MTVTRRQSLKLLAGAAGAGLAPLAHGADADSLHALAMRKGMRFGNAMGYNRFQDKAYRDLMARECGVIVPENETKWQALQAAPGKFDFARADEMFAWARKEGMQLRGHTLVWQTEKWLPDWLNKHDFGAGPALEAERILRQHIGTVCDHFGKDIYSWDVVNEAIDPADGALRSNVLTRRLGAVEEIDLAFRLAREHAPHAQLVYNDYMRGDVGSTKHRAGVLKLLHALKSRGTPVQALGLQSHIGSWDAAAGPSKEMREWRVFLDEVSAMGLDLLITEFDVNDRQLPGDIAARDAGVAALARDYLDVTLSYPRLRDFLLWGMADHVSWLQTWKEAPRTDGLAMRPTPFDAQLRAKPLRTAIADAMRAMPQRAA